MKMWTKLETANDWGVIYYAPVGQALTATGTATRTRGVALTVGKAYRFRLADGTELTGHLRSDEQRTWVGDHGKESIVIQHWLFAELSFHGNQVQLPLTTVEIELSLDELNIEGRPEYALLKPGTVVSIRRSATCPGLAVLVCFNTEPEALARLWRAIIREGLLIEEMSPDEVQDTARHMEVELAPRD